MGPSFITYVLGVRASAKAQIVRATLVDDRPTEIRSHRAASALEDRQPASNLAERVVQGITDVEPEELSAVVVRIVIKRRTGDVGANLLDGFLIHIGVEDEGNLISRHVVGGVDFPSRSVGSARGDVRINLSPVSTRIGEARKLKVDHVIEPTERTLDTKRSDKLARGGIADVLTQFAVIAEEVAARLRAGDQTENGNAVFLAKRIVSRTITNQLNAKDIEEVLRELARGSRDGGAGRRIKGVRNGGSIDSSGLINSGRDISGDSLTNDTEVLRTAAIVEDRLGQLGQLLHSLTDLCFDLERGFKVVQADAGGLVALCLELPVTNRLTEGQRIRNRVTSSGVVRGTKTR